MKNHLKLSLCLVIICVLCVLPIPVFATEIDIFSTFDAGKQSGFEPYIMPISELVPTAEGTPQPNTINMQSELVLTASVNNTSENEPGDLISTEFIYTTDGTVVEAYQRLLILTMRLLNTPHVYILQSLNEQNPTVLSFADQNGGIGDYIFTILIMCLPVIAIRL